MKFNLYDFVPKSPTCTNSANTIWHQSPPLLRISLVQEFLGFGDPEKTVLMEIHTIRGVLMVQIGKLGIWEIKSPPFMQIFKNFQLWSNQVHDH